MRVSKVFVTTGRRVNVYNGYMLIPGMVITGVVCIVRRRRHSGVLFGGGIEDYSPGEASRSIARRRGIQETHSGAVFRNILQRRHSGTLSGAASITHFLPTQDERS